jgi:hypothetical protein
MAYFIVGFILFLSAGELPSSWATTSPHTETHVNLLGQPCLLEGPYDGATLRAIHAIGPAQLYPVLSVSEPGQSVEEAKQTLNKIRTTANLPSLLDRYRDKLGKRIEAQIAFLEVVPSAQKTKDLSTFIKVGKRAIRPPGLQQFEGLINKLKTASNAKGPKTNTVSYQESVEQIFDLYNDKIEPDPEEEFHRAIKKLNIQYRCSFEDAEAGAEED